MLTTDGLMASRRVWAGLAALIVAVLAVDVVAVIAHDDVATPCGSRERLRPGPLLDCIEGNMAFVETAFGTGSAVLVDDGHLITNLHVVDPFDAVDVTFGDGERFTDVPVVGTDPDLDIAVLGPIERKGSTVFADAATVEAVGQGDPVFLVGYPSETSDDPAVTISQGILSRSRHLERYDVTFLQTDAAIGSGQSGGALVDALGHVVGISGLRLDGAYALALSSPDVTAAGRRSVTRAGHDRTTYADTAPTGTMGVSVDVQHMLAVPPADAEQRIRITFAGAAEPLVVATGLDDTPLYASANIFSLLDAAALGIDGGTYERLRSVAGSDPSVVEFSVAASDAAFVVVGAASPTETQLTYETSIPVVHYVDSDDGVVTSTGARLEGVIDFFEGSDTFVIALQQNETVDIHAGGAAGDLGYVVYAADADPADAPIVDDSDHGLLGLDARGSFTAPAAGDYVIEVFSNDVTTTGYILEVDEGG